MSTIPALTTWQKKQATLLYHFSSLDYLKGLQQRVDALRRLAEGDLNLSNTQGRDAYLRSERWGSRDTSENWANNAWPFLADFQLSVAKHIADRASQIYAVTGAYQCSRGMSEYSFEWMTAQEQEQFDAMFAELYEYSRDIDDTMYRATHASRWDDFGLTREWPKFAEQYPALPKLRVHPELTAESGHLPPRTGVYIAIDDPHASLQFAWTGAENGRLLDSTTFNDLGKRALATVGRKKLWLDGKAMRGVVLSNLSDPSLREDPFFSESPEEHLAASLIARNAFTSHPARWAYVELVSGEFETIDTEEAQDQTENLRYEGGAVCEKPGIYFTPARIDSRRHFKPGDIFPTMDSDYGTTYWQWDNVQH